MNTLLADQKEDFFRTTTCFYDTKEIHSLSLEDLLRHVLKIIKAEVQAIMDHLDTYKEIDSFILQIIEMVKAMEVFQMDFEFTLAALSSESQEEFDSLKKKFALIMPLYEKVKSKEDLTPVPAKYVVALFHDKVLVEFMRVMKSCLRRNWYGDLELIKDEAHLGRIKILTARFEVGHIQYCMVICFPKEDIFFYERSSPVWQDLYNHVDFKEILTKEEVNESSQRFFFYLYITHLIIKNQVNNKATPSHRALFSLLKDIVYYGVQQSKAETDALLYLLNADIKEVFRAWNVPEHPLIGQYYMKSIPMIGYDELIYVPRLFPAITREVILKEYEDNSFNKLSPMDQSNLINLGLSGNQEEVLKELFIKDNDRIPVRILSDKVLNLRKSCTGILRGFVQKTKEVLHEAEPDPQQKEEAIIIHIHGGGFVAMSSNTNKVYLNQWVKNMKLTHFSIDYRLAPANPYPNALDDVWQAYLWIINYATTVLGIKYQKIILAGDSAGGNLALALTLRLVRAGLNPPHGCLLMYPSLYVDAESYSPSYFESFNDPMLPYSLLKMIAKAYVPEGFKNREDPFISPMLASYELLQNLPPIRIVVGSRDPLYDDNWRLLAKLRKLNKDVKMIVHANLSHGFLSHNELKEHKYFVDEACELMKELISIPHQ